MSGATPPPTSEPHVTLLVLYAAVCVLPLALGWAAVVGMRWFVEGTPWSRGRSPEPPPLERLVADLRRLERAYREAESAPDVTARGHRLRAIGLAYDDTLRCCCEVLGLEAPRTSPLTALERISVQAELAQHGVCW